MWYLLVVDGRAIAHVLSQEFHDELYSLIERTGSLNAAIFRKDLTGGVTHFYFTPAAESMAKAHNAVPCEKPSRVEAGEFCAGDDFVRKSFFGD